MAANKLIIIGNGFDLAHGLPTSYRHFINWYFCRAFEYLRAGSSYTDKLINLDTIHYDFYSVTAANPECMEDVLQFLEQSGKQKLTYNSTFFERLTGAFIKENWVDIEKRYFQLLSGYFTNPNVQNKQEFVSTLNIEFNFLITKLTEYLKTVNATLPKIQRLPLDAVECDFGSVFRTTASSERMLVLNFNYTDTVSAKNYAPKSDVVHIHGDLLNLEANPIIFGYGDETDPVYQKIEDSGNNIYLEHIKSFAYFKTANYQTILSFIDAKPFEVYILGHSCGISDRVLLNTVFEHSNCARIHVFYHRRENGTDNFTEITHEISRHFKPQNKDLLRRRLQPKHRANYFPQSV